MKSLAGIGVWLALVFGIEGETQVSACQSDSYEELLERVLDQKNTQAKSSFPQCWRKILLMLPQDLDGSGYSFFGGFDGFLAPPLWRKKKREKGDPKWTISINNCPENHFASQGPNLNPIRDQSQPTFGIWRESLARCFFKDVLAKRTTCDNTS